MRVPGSLWQLADGTVAVAPNDPVGRQDDLSGNGNHRTQATEAARPIFTSIDGNPGLLMDGTTQFMQAEAIDLSGTQAVTFGGVYRAASGGVQILTEFSDSFNANPGAFATYVQSSQWVVSGSGTTSPAGEDMSQAALEIASITGLRATVDIGASVNKLYKNGVAAPVSTGSQGTGNRGTYPVFFYARNGGQYFYDGLALDHEFMIDRLLTAPEIAQYEAWLAGRIT